MATVQTHLQSVANTLETVTDSARLEAELLLQSTLSCSRAWLYTYPDHSLTEEQEAVLQRQLVRRMHGEPMAYILGQKEFYSLSFWVNEDVLIPRPATESLVEWVLNGHSPSPLKVLDLGTGSGAIAVTLAKRRPQWQIVATDVSLAALAVARANASRHGVERVEFVHSDWFDAVECKDFDLIVSNPPYIADGDPHLQALAFEPRSALVARGNGLSCVDLLLRQGAAYLRHGGKVVLEHGHDQSTKVIELAKKYGWSAASSHRDLAGVKRFLVASVSDCLV